MKRVKILLGVLLFVTAGYSQSLTPEVIASSGTTFTNGGSRIEFTIGEVVTSTLTGGGNTLTQGFHQPEISFASFENYEDEFSFTLYPNPTEQFVTVASTNREDMQVHVFDMNGKAIMVSQVFQENIIIDLQTLAAGNYVLRVTTKSGQPLHSCSVIKRSNY